MSNKGERRRMQLENERREERALATATPRHPHDRSWGFWGIGSLQAQLIHRPSRRAGVCYEIRGEIGDLRLHRSRSTQPGGELLSGYERIAAPSASLWQLLQALEGVQVPLRRPLEPVGVLDGETFEVAAWGGVNAVARLTWHGGSVPEGWEPLAELVASSLRAFDSLQALDEGR